MARINLNAFSEMSTVEIVIAVVAIIALIWVVNFIRNKFYEVVERQMEHASNNKIGRFIVPVIPFIVVGGIGLYIYLSDKG